MKVPFQQPVSVDTIVVDYHYVLVDANNELIGHIGGATQKEVDFIVEAINTYSEFPYG